jgi:hypothetical protein
MEDYDYSMIKQINDNECFICFEIQKEQEIPINLKHQTHFLKFCQCDGWIHYSCLKIWFNNNEKCPICRTMMLQNISLEIEYIFFIYYYFYIIKKIVSTTIINIVRFRNVIIFCILISNIINIVSNCCKYYDNYIYEYTYYYSFPPDNYYIEAS